MYPTLLYAVIALVVLALLWSLWGYMSSRTEQAAYNFVRAATDYEVRRYPAHLVAQTTVVAP